jgi:hypothetical protein
MAVFTPEPPWTTTPTSRTDALSCVVPMMIRARGTNGEINFIVA